LRERFIREHCAIEVTVRQLAALYAAASTRGASTREASPCD